MNPLGNDLDKIPLFYKNFFEKSLVHKLTFFIFPGPAKNECLPAIKHSIMEKEKWSGSPNPRIMQKKQVVTSYNKSIEKITK